MQTFNIPFETNAGNGYINYIHRDKTYKNDSYEIIVEDLYEPHTEQQLIDFIELNIFEYVKHI